MYRYTPFYCEENVWHLCRDMSGAGRELKVAFISGPSRQCAMWHQRAATSPGEVILWDYHVILLALEKAWAVWDLDTLLGMPVDAERYLRESFEQLPVDEPFAPVFRLMEAGEYLEAFSSDRSHMRNRDGSWKAPPPPWPAIHRPGRPGFMEAMVDMTHDSPGQVMRLGELRRRLGTGSMGP